MKNKIIPIVILIAILGAAGYYVLSTKKSSPNTTDQTLSQTMNEAVEFEEAIESGKPTLCTMSKSGDTMEYQLKDKKMRMKSTSVSPSQDSNKTTTINHMINDGTYLYLWDDSTKQGSKMLIPSKEEIKNLSDKTSAPQADAPVPELKSETDYKSLKEEGYSINCKTGNVADSVFVPPTDVKFIDPTAIIEALPSPDVNGKIDMSKYQELQKQYENGSASY